MKNLFRCSVFLLLVSFIAHSWPVQSMTRKRYHGIYTTFNHQKSSRFSMQSPSTDENDTAQELSKSLREQAKRAKREADRMESELVLLKISKLEKSLNDKGPNLTTSELKGIRDEILNLVRVVDPSMSVPDMEKQNANEGGSTSRLHSNILKSNSKKVILSEEELGGAIAFFVSLPRPVRLTLASVVQLDLDRVDPAVIVLSLYELGDDIPAETIASTYKAMLDADLKADSSIRINKSNLISNPVKKDQGLIITNVSELLGKTPEQYKVDSIVESLLPRVTRNKGKEPTKEDVDQFVKVACGKDTFILSAQPEKIPGGYVIRGSNQLKNGTALIQAVDLKMGSSAPEWSEQFQASFIVDPTRTNVEESGSVDGDPVLIITSSDFSPTTNRLLLSIVSSISLFFTFIYCIATFGSNDAIMKRITEANDLGNFDTTWFNDLLTPLVGAILLIQLIHESGHLLFAWIDRFKISPPTILPILSLPYLSFQTKLKSSPPDFSSLFNFAFSGPVLGMITSAIFLLLGLKLTITMDPNAVQYAPSLPVAILRLSTLGGEAVDYFLGSGDGLILSQDPLTPVPLHPFAIAGFVGLVINALDSIPIGSTDGGRLSQSLLGRTGHLVFSSLIFTGLFIYTFFSGHRDLFVTYLILNSFAEKDTEVPCRNEVDGTIGLPQAIGSLLLWVMAALILTPL